MPVAEKVKQIIVEQLGVDESQVDNKASFVDDLGADSLDTEGFIHCSYGRQVAWAARWCCRATAWACSAMHRWT